MHTEAYVVEYQEQPDRSAPGKMTHNVMQDVKDQDDYPVSEHKSFHVIKSCKELDE